MKPLPPNLEKHIKALEDGHKRKLESEAKIWSDKVQ